MRLPAPLARREVLRLPLALAAVLGPFPSLPAHAISATTMSGKSKPELGMILVDEPKQTGASISAEAVLPGGKVAAISYQSKFPLVSGGYYDVETMASFFKSSSAARQLSDRTPRQGSRSHSARWGCRRLAGPGARVC